MSIRRNGLAAGICFVIALILWLAGLAADDEALASRLGRQVLRFHVIADSNDPNAQSLKLSVRSFLLDRIYEDVGESASKEEILDYLAGSEESLIKETNEFIRLHGGTYEASLEIRESYFPTKVYGDMVFPAGNYESVKVILGQGKGRNWWCVLYPSLCFVSDTQAVVPEASKQQLKNVLTEDDFQSLLSAHPKIRFSFRLEEWWDSLWQKEGDPLKPTQD